MADLNTAISPAPAVTCLTTGGVVATGYTGDVTVSLGTNPTGATLGGTLTVAAVAGVATFSNLTLNRSGKNFKLSATASGLRTVTSNAFSIPTECVFTTQPSYAPLNTAIPSVVVTVQDSAGNPDTTYNGTVTVALYTASAAGTLSGTKSVTAVAGVATFSTLTINVAGTYTLIASATEISTAYKPASVVSSSFYVGPYTLTSADLGSDTFGYNTTNGGSILPTTYLGATVRILQTQYVDVPDPGLDYTTTFNLSGTFSQNAFTSITIGGVTLLTADATTFSGAGPSEWVWETATGPITTTGSFTITFT